MNHGLEELKHVFNSRFEEMDKKLERRLDGMQHEMQQSRLAYEAGAKRERTGERGDHAAVNGGYVNTSS